jgi:hypothetical protein
MRIKYNEKKFKQAMNASKKKLEAFLHIGSDSPRTTFFTKYTVKKG